MPQAAARSPKPLHIFKPGRWTTVAGETIEFTEAEVRAMAAAYSPAKHKAPIVVGHPALDAPARGWVESLSADERGLFAVPTKVDPAFAEEARAGRWGTVSARFYRPDSPANPVPGVWYLRHIGVLGAQPPGVKGLLEPEFAEGEGEDGCVSFTEGVAFGEWDAMTNATLWRQLRDWFVSQFGLEQADKVLPNYEVRALELAAHEDAARAAIAQVAFSESQGNPTNPTATPPTKESVVTEAEVAALKAQNEALQAQVEQAQAREAAAARAARAAEHVAFAESLISAGKVPEADKARLVAMADAIHPAGQEVMFGEGDSQTTLYAQFKQFMEGLQPKVEFGEHATRGRAAASQAGSAVAYAENADPERIELDKKIRAYMAQHNVGYAQAARAVAQ